MACGHDAVGARRNSDSSHALAVKLLFDRGTILLTDPSKELNLAEAPGVLWDPRVREGPTGDRKSTRLNSSHVRISYAVFCLKKKKKNNRLQTLQDNMTPNVAQHTYETQISLA